MAVENHGRASGFYLNIGKAKVNPKFNLVSERFENQATSVSFQSPHKPTDDDDDDVIHFSFLSVHLLFPRYVSFGF